MKITKKSLSYAKLDEKVGKCKKVRLSTKRRRSLEIIRNIFRRKSGVESKMKTFRRRCSMESIEFWEVQ